MNLKKQPAINKLIRGYFQLYPVEAARSLETLPADEIVNYLKAESIARATELYAGLNPEIAAGLAAAMDANYFSELYSQLDSLIAARLLSRLGGETAAKQLSLLPSSRSAEIKELMNYPPETAGYIMDPRVQIFHPEDTIAVVLEKIRDIKSRRINDVNVVDEKGHLTGVVPLQNVAVSQPYEKLGDLITGQPVSIQSMAPQEEVVQLLEEQKLVSLPVVDLDGVLLGVIRYDALINAAKMDAVEGVQTMFGAGKDERALSKVSFAIRKRLPWLEINLATAFLAAAVVGLFEETIARITVLAVFLPVVAGQSGNTGSQALAVTMRGLALREIRSRHWFRVARKEILVGFFNGVAVALTTSIIVFFWADSFGLAVVIAVAMVASMTIAGLSGAVIPIILKALGQDPAQSSSIILTTVTDIAGFMSFLGLATLLASILNIS